MFTQTPTQIHDVCVEVVHVLMYHPPISMWFMSHVSLTDMWHDWVVFSHCNTSHVPCRRVTLWCNRFRFHVNVEQGRVTSQRDNFNPHVSNVTWTCTVTALHVDVERMVLHMCRTTLGHCSLRDQVSGFSY